MSVHARNDNMKKLLLVLLILSTQSLLSQPARLKDSDTLKTSTFSGLKFRNIGPAVISGRVIAFAVNPKDRGQYYVGVASGGVWKTVNSGTTFEPVFEHYGSYSIGSVAINPSNSHEVWVGTGEANSQRSVSYGDGVYKSEDDGHSFKNIGLKNSEHIAVILFDPRDTKIVYVAAQGPLWSAGGDRGLYKTTDAGKSWTKILNISDNTGVTDIVLDPRNPDILYAASYQRRRHRWTMIDGGPESAIHKSTDAGQSWNKLSSGLPDGDLGRIGIAISPVNPDILYATVEAEADNGGIFRSTDRGETWEKRNPHVETQMYYGRMICDPFDIDRIYVPGTLLMVSDDGGKTIYRLPIKNVHVDNHTIWPDPTNRNHFLLGGDGGVYESYDQWKTWSFRSNLPTAQFYRVSVDNTVPFYYVYGGTQDNASFGGPSRTINASGIVNSDWIHTTGGDGFKTVIDPSNPNIVYSESQYGGLVRYDKKTGEELGIRPIEGKGEPSLRWNWDSPLLLSPHLSSRVYFGANKLFRSDDYGSTWTAISGDLTRQLDRNKLPVMGKIWPPEAINKHGNTAFWGNLSFISESPKVEGLIYVGTDDGLIQVTEDGGKTWWKIEKFKGIPEMTYISSVQASLFDASTVYASFDNHQMGDFKPYILKSADKGKSWSTISSNLPENGTVLCIAQDPVDANMLFVGTEYGIHFTVDGGKTWTQLKAGLPTIAVTEIAIQARENDLVLSTFGRGFYILDDYTPLRMVSSDIMAKEAYVFPVKETSMYVQRLPLGGDGKAWQGDAFFSAENPPFGATVTYYLKKSFETMKKIREDAEKKTVKDGKFEYPSLDTLRAEVDEDAPAILFTVKDESGNVVRRLKGSNSEGINRVTWDLRLMSPDPIAKSSDEAAGRGSWLAMPGKYTVAMSKRVDGVETLLAGPAEFNCSPLGMPSIPNDRQQLLTFETKASKLQRAVLGALNVLNDTRSKIDALKTALAQTSHASPALYQNLLAIQDRLTSLYRSFSGDEVAGKYNDNGPPTLLGYVDAMTQGFWSSTASPTGTEQKAYGIAADEFTSLYVSLRQIVENDLPTFEKNLDQLGAPWTPGRLPEWKKE
jgi:photosystem II stability/assembly factor-like uncharacterized protein